jgi:hypothetical protein
VQTDIDPPEQQLQPGSPVVLRRPSGWLLCAVFAISAGVAGHAALADLQTSGSTSPGIATAANGWELALISVVALAAAVRYLFVRVQVGPGGLEVHNVLTNWKEPWSEIAGFTTISMRGRYGTTYAPVMVLRSGRHHELSALSSGDESVVEASITRLQSLAPSGAAPGFVSRSQVRQLMFERQRADPAAPAQAPAPPPWPPAAPPPPPGDDLPPPAWGTQPPPIADDPVLQPPAPPAWPPAAPPVPPGDDGPPDPWGAPPPPWPPSG